MVILFLLSISAVTIEQIAYFHYFDTLTDVLPLLAAALAILLLVVAVYNLVKLNWRLKIVTTIVSSLMAVVICIGFKGQMTLKETTMITTLVDHYERNGVAYIVVGDAKHTIELESERTFYEKISRDHSQVYVFSYRSNAFYNGVVRDDNIEKEH
jgi:hypothetical protein